MSTQRATTRGRAFTIVELLLVISILVLLLAIGVPAFASMLYSSNQSMAENSLRVGLTAARDAALRSNSGQHAAAVFFYEPGGRLSIVACVKVGELVDEGAVRRDIYVPMPQIEPVQLPQGWTIRGYAPPGSTDNTYWYEQNGYQSDRDKGHWLLPETGFFRADVNNDGEDRQTFMVVFEGGTGILMPSSGETPALVLAPSPSTAFRTGGLFGTHRPDREADPARYVRRILALPDENDHRELLGDESSDTVLARSVGQLALCNERRLVSGIGLRPDRATGTLYRAAPTSGDWDPEFIPGVDVEAINNWIQRGPDVDNPGEEYDSDARVFSVQRYLGSLQEIAQ